MVVSNLDMLLIWPKFSEGVIGRIMLASNVYDIDIGYAHPGG